MKKLVLAMTAVGALIAPSVFGLTVVGAGCPTTRVVALHPTTVVAAPVRVIAAPRFIGWQRPYYTSRVVLRSPVIGTRFVGYNYPYYRSFGYRPWGTRVVAYNPGFVRTGFVGTRVIGYHPGFVRTGFVRTGVIGCHTGF